MRSVLVVDGVGKRFARYRSEWDRVLGWFGLGRAPIEERWVLRDISFRVDRGEAVALIGANGAGKSTLLKIITGTTRASLGQVAVNGQVSALLELGLGFNPELTGRQNALHMLSMRGVYGDRAEALVQEVEDFAEIGEYFDQPLRVYSSGMQVRVAFSVATAIRPEVLIVDEALSVGDAYFVHKSFERIRSFRETGTTLLFVSHDPSAVRTLCDRAILLEQGRVAMEGDPSEVLDFYNARVAEKEKSSIRVGRSAEGVASTRSGSGEAGFVGVELVDAEGQPVSIARVGDELQLRVTVDVVGSIPALVFGFMLRDRTGQPVFGTNTHHTGQVLQAPEAGSRWRFDVRLPVHLGPGSYSISVALHADDTHLSANYEWWDLAVVFQVVNLAHPTFVGCAWIQTEIQTQPIMPVLQRGP